MFKRAKALSLGLAAGIAAGSWGCGRAEVEQHKEAARPAEQADGTDPVVARVDGHPIFASEVVSLIRDAKTRLGPRDAVEILIRNELLAAEARRRGITGTPEVEDTRDAELARLLLEKEIGQKVTKESLDPGMLKEGYDLQKERFVHGRLRRTDHILARTGKDFLPEDEARKLAERAAGLAAKVRSEAEFLEVGNALVKELKEKVKVEKLPPVAENSTQLVAPFVKGTFAIPKVGGISPPVRTDFGWHVIYLAEELPAENRSFEEARDIIAGEVLPKVREAKAAEFVEKLLKEKGVFVFENDPAAGDTAP